MGKEGDLLKAVKERDVKKVQKLLTPSVKKSQEDSLCWQSTNASDKIRVELRHINVNVAEADSGYTPLHVAVLQGVKDIAERLVFNCADVNAKDTKGNSPLHLAVFQGREDLVDLLLFNDAQINEENNDGNTPLHIACESGESLSDKIIKRLIKAGAIVWTRNKYRYSALDVAAMFGKNDHVKTLLEYSPTLTANKTALIEASIRGHAGTVELLLDCGVHVNDIDDSHGSTALHEAVRYLRLAVVKVLMRYGAESHLVNMKRETPQSIADSLPAAVALQMKQCFDESATSASQTVEHQIIRTRNDEECEYAVCRRILPHIKTYPDIPSDLTWTQNRPTFCSSCTEKNPNSHILDGNPRTLWVVPVLHNAWTVLDLHTEHVISGISVFGWNSPQMLKTFQLQTSDNLAGPWTTVTTHTCRLLGSTDAKQPGFPQKFEGFTFQSRFVRLYLVDNHGGSYICFHGIQLYGADCQVIDTLTCCDLSYLADEVINKGMNTWQRFLDFTELDMDDMVRDPLKKASLLSAIYKGRKTMYPMTFLKWVTPPIHCIYVDEVLPEFRVQSDTGVTEVVHLVVQGGQIQGDVCQRLVPQGHGKPSMATFSNVSIKPAGLYNVIVKNDATDIQLEAPQPTEVRLEVKTQNDISSAFDEIQDMLSKMQEGLTFD